MSDNVLRNVNFETLNLSKTDRSPLNNIWCKRNTHQKGEWQKLISCSYSSNISLCINVYEHGKHRKVERRNWNIKILHWNENNIIFLKY